MIAFGPIPSRRLGRSLGVNNIPPKVCSYSCVYCQLGRTLRVRVGRYTFYEPQEVSRAVRSSIDRAAATAEAIDYLTFVPDGEPTMDINLGRQIALLKPLGIPMAVITNNSLTWREDVRRDLASADWVSLKIDAIDEAVWRRINRPHRSLHLPSLLEGAQELARSYPGKLVTETMLVADINDGPEHHQAVAEFVARLQPAVAYLLVPTRPPAEEWVHAPGETALNRAYQIFSARVRQVELLTGYEGNAFASSGNIEEDLLSITAVHPLREDAVGALLSRTGADWHTVQELIAQGQLVETAYGQHKFYVRRLRRAG